MSNTETAAISTTELMLKMLQGGTIGTVSTVVMTPTYNAYNHQLANKYFGFKQLFSRSAFKGVGSYCMATVPNYAIAFGMQRVLAEVFGQSDSAKFFSTVRSGGIAGVMTIPFETNAQMQQLRGGSIKSINAQIMTKQGYGGFFLGGGVSALQYAGWALAYAWAPEMLSARIQQYIGLSVAYADHCGAIAAGSVYGASTSYLSYLRFVKQQHAVEECGAPSYPSIVKAVAKGRVTIGGTEQPVPNLWKIAARRTLFSAAAVGVVKTVEKAYDRVSEFF